MFSGQNLFFIYVHEYWRSFLAPMPMYLPPECDNHPERSSRPHQKPSLELPTSLYLEDIAITHWPVQVTVILDEIGP